MANDITLYLGLALIVLGGLVAAMLVYRRMTAAGRSRDRLFATIPGEDGLPQEIAEPGFVRRWLFLAGYRGTSAPVWFVTLTVLAVTVGSIVSYTFLATGLQRLMSRSVGVIPGGVGEVFLPIVYVAPWLILLLVALAPWLIVRQSRRSRVEQVDQDLPLALELLATLSEAGLGFDAALARILETRLADRPLAQEFRSFQADLLSGRARIESLRRLARRLEVSSVSIFVSALVQADQLGMGIAGVLRRQADDLRDRRRERANAFASTLPVKRLFPLVICFLPGLFVWTLGPFFVQLFQLADTFTRVRNF